MTWLLHLLLLRWFFRPRRPRPRWRDIQITRGLWPFAISPFRVIPLLVLALCLSLMFGS